MRRMLMTVAAVVLAGGSALAVERYDDDAARANIQTMRIRHYAFDAYGPSADQAAAERCAGGQMGATHRYRTRGDIAAAVFSGGWYTPVHVDVACDASARLP